MEGHIPELGTEFRRPVGLYYAPLSFGVETFTVDISYRGGTAFQNLFMQKNSNRWVYAKQLFLNTKVIFQCPDVGFAPRSVFEEGKPCSQY